ncbi:MAG: hypothetical protein ACLR0U_32510 [Enterocloster clostridioformis]
MWLLSDAAGAASIYICDQRSGTQGAGYHAAAHIEGHGVRQGAWWPRPSGGFQGRSYICLYKRGWEALWTSWCSLCCRVTGIRWT